MIIYIFQVTFQDVNVLLNGEFLNMPAGEFKAFMLRTTQILARKTLFGIVTCGFCLLEIKIDFLLFFLDDTLSILFLMKT